MTSLTVLNQSPLNEKYEEILARKSVTTLVQNSAKVPGFQMRTEDAHALGVMAQQGTLSSDALIAALYKGRAKDTAKAKDFARAAHRKIATQQRLREKLEARKH